MHAVADCEWCDWLSVLCVGHANTQEDYEQIVEGITEHLGVRYPGVDLTHQFDHVFWTGV